VLKTEWVAWTFPICYCV